MNGPVMQASQADLLLAAKTAVDAEDFASAATAYLLLAGLHPSNAEYLYEAGWCKKKLGLFDETISLYERASSIKPNPGYWLGLGTTLEKEGDDRARQYFERTLSEDPNATDIDRQLLAYLPWYKQRRRITKFFEKRIGKVRDAVADMTWKPERSPLVFMYWNSGFEGAPPLVRACFEQVKRTTPTDAIAVLSQTTWPFYVSIPEHVTSRVPQNTALFSDILRCALLARYGGVWLDATCYPSRNVLDFHKEVSAPGFFAYQRTDEARISSWYMSSSGDNYIAKMMFAAQCEYWTHYGKSLHYYLVHHIFESLYYLDERFKTIWDARERIDADPPHKLQRAMFNQYDPTQFQNMFSRSSIHKLTYKFKDRIPSPDTVIAHIIRRDVPV